MRMMLLGKKKTWSFSLYRRTISLYSFRIWCFEVVYIVFIKYAAVQFIIYNGDLGSFGHFQASKSGVHKGGLDQSLVKAGFVATRISVRWTDFLYLLFLDFLFLSFWFQQLCRTFLHFSRLSLWRWIGYIFRMIEVSLKELGNWV